MTCGSDPSLQALNSWSTRGEACGEASERASKACVRVVCVRALEPSLDSLERCDCASTGRQFCDVRKGVIENRVDDGTGGLEHRLTWTPFWVLEPVSFCAQCSPPRTGSMLGESIVHTFELHPVVVLLSPSVRQIMAAPFPRCPGANWNVIVDSETCAPR